MLFNSLIFAAFLPLVFALYWALQHRLRLQNIALIAAGFVFYGWWDPRFLLLLIATSLTDYFVALALGRTTDPRKRRWLLAISLIGNLGTLGTFKYFDFFSLEFAHLVAHFGFSSNPVLLHVILPVGISFYTFQALSYTIDVYRKRIEPVHDITVFVAFVSFFPQLCAGPIERASHMLPQFQRKRVFDPALAADGLRQMLWGLFKKVAVADQCAPVVDAIFADQWEASASTLVLGAVLFAFQIYADFSGYSDIAIGCARLFGFELMRNFAYPYFSRDIAEFWRRWHISLTTWFRDYLYIPLGGSRGSRAMQVRNVFIIFLISGFWHGANWTFLAWGAINAFYFLPLLLRRKNRTSMDTVAAGRSLPTMREAWGMLTTFLLTVLAFIFFRSENMSGALHYIKGIFSTTLLERPMYVTVTVVVTLTVMLTAEWLQRQQQHALKLDTLPRPVRWAFYIPLALTVGLMSGEKVTFIYFQF